MTLWGDRERQGQGQHEGEGGGGAGGEGRLSAVEGHSLGRKWNKIEYVFSTPAPRAPIPPQGPPGSGPLGPFDPPSFATGRRCPCQDQREAINQRGSTQSGLCFATRCITRRLSRDMTSRVSRAIRHSLITGMRGNSTRESKRSPTTGEDEVVPHAPAFFFFFFF